MMRRNSGVLLPVFSLPSKFGIGDFGNNAKIFIDYLKKAGFNYWQILPLTPTGAVNGYSPYSSSSAFAGNFLFIDPMFFASVGLLQEEELLPFMVANSGHCDYEHATKAKQKIISVAYENFSANFGKFSDLKKEFDEFAEQNCDWLVPYADFVTAKNVFSNVAWCDFPEGIKERDEGALTSLREQHKKYWDTVTFAQFVFFKQLGSLYRYAKGKGIDIISDLPFYVSYDSSDVWADKANFSLYEDGSQRGVAGVPPDYFSPTGQRWGNPIYDWDYMEQDNFSWWRRRIKHTLSYSSLCRIDHMRALEAYWRINENCDTAIDGEWIKAPGYKLLNILESEYGGKLPLIAEDLGVITPNVRRMLTRFKLPGMKVLQFAFDSDKKNLYLPQNINENSVCYTGTHDNDTLLGWCKDRDAESVKKIRGFLKIREELTAEELAEKLIRTCLASKSKWAILPMQDILHKDSTSRTNIPGTCSGNWAWRMTDEDFAFAQENKNVRYIRNLNKMTERTPYFTRSAEWKLAHTKN